jgi:hypothetical protein
VLSTALGLVVPGLISRHTIARCAGVLYTFFGCRLMYIGYKADPNETAAAEFEELEVPIPTPPPLPPSGPTCVPSAYRPLCTAAEHRARTPPCGRTQKRCQRFRSPHLCVLGNHFGRPAHRGGVQERWPDSAAAALAGEDDARRRTAQGPRAPIHVADLYPDLHGGAPSLLPPPPSRHILQHSTRAIDD